MTAIEPRPSRPQLPPGDGMENAACPSGERPALEAGQRVATVLNYWVCTIRSDGRPHAKPVWGFWLEGAGATRAGGGTHGEDHPVKTRGPETGPWESGVPSGSRERPRHDAKRPHCTGTKVPSSHVGGRRPRRSEDTSQQPCQGGGRGFESRRPLQTRRPTASENGQVPDCLISPLTSEEEALIGFVAPELAAGSRAAIVPGCVSARTR